jgi:hemolysin D
LAQEARVSRTQLQELQSTIDTTAQRIHLAEAQVSLTTIVAPVAGTVTELKIKNAGELVGAGTPVASIVPESVPLVAEVAVPNKDIGFVRAGTDVRVKIDAFPFRQFGTVAATVAQVLPNADAENNFRVKIRLQRTTLGADDSIHLFPGLTVQADILTAEQRLLSVIFSKQ